jgi:lipoprotein-releasing system ATP-binding protein
MTEQNVILRCANLNKSFSLDRKASSLEVLKGIDLTVGKGEIISIVGASGSGKSTLLHILGGLDRPASGNVWWNEEDILALPDEELALRRGKNIGFVFQFHHLLPEFSALENVMIPQMIQGKSMHEAKARAKELLEKVNVVHRDDHRPGELSGGEQQRIAVARALANRPAIIFADEPSGNLDSDNSRQLHALLIGLNRTEGQTLVIVTHNEEFARQASRKFKMSDGKLLPV